MFNQFAFHGLSPERVELCQPDEVLHWCGLWRCSEHELRAAVYAVGSQPGEVGAYFNRSFRQKLSNAWHKLHG